MPNLLKTLASQQTHPGRRKPNNEDYVAFYVPTNPDDLLNVGCLYIVADGVGGAAHGEQASRYAVQKVLFDYYQPSALPPAQRLDQAIVAASHDIYNYSRSDKVGSQMATTIVAALVLRNQLYIANVGDSPAYLIRGGQIQQISREHSLIGERIRDGTLTEEQARHSHIKNQLTRSLGGDDDVLVDISEPISLLPGDRVLLCTDGVTRYASRSQILKLVEGVDPEEAVNRLIDFANQSGGADNITALFFSIESQETDGLAVAAQPSRQPGAVRIEDMETYMPGVPSRQHAGARLTGPAAKRMTLARRLENRRLQFWVLAAGVVLVLMTVGSIFAVASPQVGKVSGTSATSAGEIVKTTPAPVLQATLALTKGTLSLDGEFTITPTATPQIAQTPSVTIKPTLTITVSPTSSPTPTHTNTPTSNSYPPGVDAKTQCLVQVIDASENLSLGTVSGISKKFGGIDITSTSKYVSGCVISVESNWVEKCTEKIGLKENGDIHPKEWVIVPLGSNSMKACIINGGKYFQPN